MLLRAELDKNVLPNPLDECVSWNIVAPEAIEFEFSPKVFAWVL